MVASQIASNLPADGRKRSFLSGRDAMKILKYAVVSAAVLSLGLAAAEAKPKTNMLHQWDSGADAAAIAKLGEMFTAASGEWQQTSIAGHTANTLAKLR